MSTLETKTCKHCGTQFTPTTRARKYCTNECSTAAARKRAREYKHGRQPKTEGRNTGTRNYKPKTCAWCGKEFTPTTPRGTYCSYQCRRARNRARMRKYHATIREREQESRRKYYKLNKEAILEQERERERNKKERTCERKRKYYEANKEKCLERQRKYYHANRERLIKQRREYDAINASKIRAYRRKYFETNREAINERIKKWRANNPDKVGEATARRARAELDGNATPQLIKAKWEASDKTCILCGNPIDPKVKAPNPNSRTLEHLTPIIRGGRHDMDNLDFAHYGCNASKRDKTLEEYRAWQQQAT